MKIDKYLNEATNNKAIAKKLKNIYLKIQGIEKKVRKGEFPYDNPQNLKDIFDIELVGLKMAIDDIMRMVR